jgi:hypothetical protein
MNIVYNIYPKLFCYQVSRPLPLSLFMCVGLSETSSVRGMIRIMIGIPLDQVL